MSQASKWVLDLPKIISDPLLGDLNRSPNTRSAVFDGTALLADRSIDITIVTYKPEALAANLERAGATFADLHRVERPCREKMATWLPEFAKDSGYDLDASGDCSEWLELSGIYVTDSSIEVHFRFLPDPEYLFRHYLIDGEPSIYTDIEH